MPAPLSVYPTVVGFQAMQQLNKRWIRDITTGGPLHEEILGVAAITILDSVIGYVPVLTGTLRAAQIILMMEGESEAWITTAHVQNPLFGNFADQYAPDVLERIDFYTEGYVDAQYLLEAQIYDVIEVEVLG